MSSIGPAALLPYLIVLPLIAAILTVLYPSNKQQSGLSLIIGAIQGYVVFLLVNALYALPSGNIEYQLAGWGSPLGIDLAIDGFSALLIALTCLLNLVLMLYSTCYFSNQAQQRQFWPLWWLLNAGLNGLFLSADIFNIYVTLEIIGLASVALVALGHQRDSLVAALRYLLVGLLGSLCYLMAVALLYRAYGTLDFSMLAANAQSDVLTWTALSLITAGLALKTALVPLHFWLPLAHGSAPAPVSAVLSALVVKASFYLLARFWMDILQPAVTETGLFLLGVLGAIAILWGVYQAIKAQRLKLMVAYSTVAQIGYLFLLFPLLMSGDTSSQSTPIAALTAISFFIVAHACAKAAMFMAAGNMIKVIGHDDIEHLNGKVKEIPLSLFTFAIAGISLIGLPPSAGFIAKWLLLNAAIDTAQWWWAIIVLLGGLLAAIAIFRVLDIAFMQPQKEQPGLQHSLPTKRLPKVMSLCGLCLAIFTMLMGFNAQPFIDLVAIGVVR
ncbi:complex I subunit 5 family protein [Algicola sagamiensis]|uniref:complex I subunit 5 family protein n=1 Tax=Algicola sagamiensis TaxID=163869 RepID=UPI00035C798E|nr:proton-conducting transporter membrane subunit [Algicola sagamiensis]